MHLKKRMTFHGVEYIVVPVELWDSAVSEVGLVKFPSTRQLYADMLAYESTNSEVEKAVAEIEAQEQYVKEQSRSR